MKTKGDFTENEFLIIYEYIHAIATEIYSQQELYLIIKLMFSQPQPPIDNQGEVLFEKYNVNPEVMLNKFLRMDEYELLFTTRIINYYGVTASENH